MAQLLVRFGSLKLTERRSKNRMLREYLPGVFPEYVPLVFVIELLVPLDEAHLFQYFLNDRRDAALSLVDQLVPEVWIVVPLHLILALKTARGRSARVRKIRVIV